MEVLFVIAKSNTEFFNGQIVKRTVIYAYHGILLSSAKEQTMDTCNNVDEFRRIMPNEKASPKIFYTIWFYLWNILEITKIIEMENRLVVFRI